LVLIALVAVACNAAPAKLDEDKPIEIISSNSEMNADGSYSFE
jgi:lipopolysaccharide export system protein LptA